MANRTSPFSIPAYRYYWLARFCSTIALNGMVVIIGWQVYDVARRTMEPREAAVQLGLIGVAQFLPLLLLTLVTGLVVLVRLTVVAGVLAVAGLVSVVGVVVRHGEGLPLVHHGAWTYHDTGLGASRIRPPGLSASSPARG